MMVSEEEKRWVIIGIAMNKVTAPVLRDFIKQGMDTHYANLDIYCSGLPTPCTQKTLTYHHVNADPSFKQLKFQNVNNNFHLHGNKKHLYNYNINSSVDLAKLFLPDYLAEFSAFDESLDMSTILRLLGFNNPAPVFHSPNPMISIQTSADDVRENVRNMWGHSNFTDWTEALFNDCFSKLETLVRSLGLTGGIEKTTLDQLSEWQTKGFQLYTGYMGHTVDKGDLALPDAASDATVKEKLQEDTKTLREEIDESIKRLVSTGKIPSAELSRIVQGLQDGTANIKVEELGQGLATTDDKMEKLLGGLHDTDDKVKPLDQEINSQMTKDLPEQMFQTLQQMQHNASEFNSKTDPSVELMKIASEKGFLISDNQGAGNCMFHALSEQLDLVKGIQISHKELRQSIVQYLERNPQMPDGTDLFNFVAGYPSWVDYLTTMERDGTWGDHVILYAAANCYETCIRVISSLQHDQEITIRPDRLIDSTDSLVLGHVYELHYVSLQQIKVPNEINARGPKAKIAYEFALKIGKVKVYRVRVMVIGQDRAGKTSLKKSLLGMPFDPEEQSTVGIEVDPSSFKVDVDHVKNWQRTDEKLGVSQFAQELAKMAAEKLEKEDVPKEKSSQVLINDSNTSHKESADSSSPGKVEEASIKNDHDSLRTEEKSENATKGPQLNIDPALPPEEFTQHLIEHLKGLNLNTNTTSTEPLTVVDLWDFAGQHLYYASHSVFLSRRAIYLLVCNLSKGLNETAQPCVRQGIHTERLENPNGRTNMDDLLSWLVSISATSCTCPSKQGLAEEKLPYIRPPAFIIGTHADKPFQDIKEMQSQIEREISEKDYGKHVIPVFICIDNTRSSADEGVGELKKEIMKVFKQEPYMGELVPVRGFNFEKVVQALVAEETYYLGLEQLQTIVQEVCFIESESETDVMLDFYHDLGMIVKHGSTVVLQAQWLIDIFKQLITIPRYKDMEPKHKKNWKHLQREGVLRMELVRHVFSKFTQQQGSVTEKDILGMMERFGLIAEFATSPTDVSYFVPSQLRFPSPEDLCEKSSSCDPCPLYVDFSSGYVPHGLFSQLVSRCIRWCSENKFEQLPRLFHCAAKFFVGKPVTHHFILVCKKRFIKIVVNQIESNANEAAMADEEEVGSLVRMFLEDTLKDMKLRCPG